MLQLEADEMDFSLTDDTEETGEDLLGIEQDDEGYIVLPDALDEDYEDVEESPIKPRQTTPKRNLDESELHKSLFDVNSSDLEKYNKLPTPTKRIPSQMPKYISPLKTNQRTRDDFTPTVTKTHLSKDDKQRLKTKQTPIKKQISIVKQKIVPVEDHISPRREIDSTTAMFLDEKKLKPGFNINQWRTRNDKSPASFRLKEGEEDEVEEDQDDEQGEEGEEIHLEDQENQLEDENGDEDGNEEEQEEEEEEEEQIHQPSPTRRPSPKKTNFPSQQMVTQSSTPRSMSRSSSRNSSSTSRQRHVEEPFRHDEPSPKKPLNFQENLKEVYQKRYNVPQHRSNRRDVPTPVPSNPKNNAKTEDDLHYKFFTQANGSSTGQSLNWQSNYNGDDEAEMKRRAIVQDEDEKRMISSNFKLWEQKGVFIPKLDPKVNTIEEYRYIFNQSKLSLQILERKKNIMVTMNTANTAVQAFNDEWNPFGISMNTFAEDIWKDRAQLDEPLSRISKRYISRVKQNPFLEIGAFYARHLFNSVGGSVLTALFPKTMENRMKGNVQGIQNVNANGSSVPDPHITALYQKLEENTAVMTKQMEMLRINQENQMKIMEKVIMFCKNLEADDEEVEVVSPVKPEISVSQQSSPFLPQPISQQSTPSKNVPSKTPSPYLVKTQQQPQSQPQPITIQTTDEMRNIEKQREMESTPNNIVIQKEEDEMKDVEEYKEEEEEEGLTDPSATTHIREIAQFQPYLESIKKKSLEMTKDTNMGFSVYQDVVVNPIPKKETKVVKEFNKILDHVDSSTEKKSEPVPISSTSVNYQYETKDGTRITKTDTSIIFDC